MQPEHANKAITLGKLLKKNDFTNEDAVLFVERLKCLSEEDVDKINDDLIHHYIMLNPYALKLLISFAIKTDQTFSFAGRELDNIDDSKDEFSNDILMKAVRLGDYDLVLALLQYHKKYPEDGINPAAFHNAVMLNALQGNHIEIAMLLLCCLTKEKTFDQDIKDLIKDIKQVPNLDNMYIPYKLNTLFFDQNLKKEVSDFRSILSQNTNLTPECDLALAKEGYTKISDQKQVKSIIRIYHLDLPSAPLIGFVNKVAKFCTNIAQSCQSFMPIAKTIFYSVFRGIDINKISEFKIPTDKIKSQKHTNNDNSLLALLPERVITELAENSFSPREFHQITPKKIAPEKLKAAEEIQKKGFEEVKKYFTK